MRTYLTMCKGTQGLFDFFLFLSVPPPPQELAKERRCWKLNNVNCLDTPPLSLSSFPPQSKRHFLQNIVQNLGLLRCCLLSAQWKSVRRFSHPPQNEWQIGGQLLVTGDQPHKSRYHVWHKLGPSLAAIAKKKP